MTKRYKHILFLSSVFLLSLGLFSIVGGFETYFHSFIENTHYLTWHNTFEFAAILVSFAVFVVSYYTYEQTGNARSLFLGSIFLFMGFMDAFHTLSFKGMPEFFVHFTGSNRATTFWIISRLIGSLGIAAAGLIPVSGIKWIKKRILFYTSLLLSVFFLILVSYFPDTLPPMFIEETGLTPLKRILEYVIVLFMLSAIIIYIREYFKKRDFLLVAISAALILSIFSEFAFISYSKQIYDIYNFLGHIYKAVAFFIFFRVLFIYNVQKPYEDLSKAKKELKKYATDLDKLVDERTEEIKRINIKLLEDLEYAKDIQLAILPTQLPKEERVDFDARYYPAERVSGDFYNLFKLDEENIGFYIGDVSGHGVSAAMMTVFVNQSIKTVRELDDGSIEILKPSVVLKNIDRTFKKTTFKEEVYLVMLYGIFNMRERRLSFASAGLNVPPIWVKSTGKVEELEIRGYPVLKHLDFIPVEFLDSEIVLNIGDKLFFYTDGLIDAQNQTGDYFSSERLIRILKENAALPVRDITKRISSELLSFLSIDHLKDDVTFFVMDVK